MKLQRVRFIGIYDGDCGICSAFVEHVCAASKAPTRIRFVPSHRLSNEELRQYRLTRAMCSEAFALVDTALHETPFLGATAICETLAIAQHPLGSIARALRSFAPTVALMSAVYKIVAKKRGEISWRVGLNACTNTIAEEWRGSGDSVATALADAEIR